MQSLITEVEMEIDIKAQHKISYFTNVLKMLLGVTEFLIHYINILL